MIDAVELGLQRRGNGFRHVRRAGARPAGANVDDRRRNLRILLDRDQLQRDRADKVISSAITIAKRGRRIKNVSIASPLFTQQLNGRAVTQALGAFRHYALPRFQTIGHHEALAMLTGGR